jgi:hypothetical protein
MGPLMRKDSARPTPVILAMVAAISFLTGGHAIGAIAVSTVQTWPARSGAALSSDDVLKVTEIGGVAGQPGGRLVSFTTLRADPACDCYHVKLKVLDLTTHAVRTVSDLGQPFRIVMPDGSVNGWPCVAESLWSKDGRYLAYIVNRRNHGALSVYDARTRESRALFLGGNEVFAFTWSGSGDRIIYQTGGPQPASLNRWKRGERDGFLYGPDFAADPESMPLIARVPEAGMFKSADAIFAHDRAWSDLRVVNVATGGSREATPTESAFVATSDFSYSQQPHQDATEVKSPGGHYEIRLGQAVFEYSGRPITIRQYDGGSIRKTSAEVCPGQNRTRDAVLAYWDASADRFVLICTDHGDMWVLGAPASIVALNPTSGLTRVLSTIGATNPEGELGRQCGLAAGKMICVREQPSEPPALYELGLVSRTWVKLYDPNAELRQRQFPRVDRLVWANHEGLSTRADLVYPYAYRSNTRYPFVVTQYMDGGFLRGNTGDENPDFAYANAGFFVLNFAQTKPAPEKRGLSYMERNKRQWRGNKWRKSIQDSLDIVIQSLIDRGLVDPSRVAYTGLSGGSNQIDYALANGRRISVVITSTCCMDPNGWVTNPLDPGFYDFADLENPATDKDLTKWSAVSPVLHVKDIHAAILANVSEHERFGFQALWALMAYAHKPMETYIYADEYHVKFHPAHLAAIQHRNIDWLRFWLEDREDPDPAKASQYARWRHLRADWCRHDAKCLAQGGRDE